ncbi:MAG: hypothetical protein H7256_13555 [Bdellovibrio sp.]|nr:hypothetical protein [Bdellovibrio sp.]
MSKTSNLKILSVISLFLANLAACTTATEIKTVHGDAQSPSATTELPAPVAATVSTNNPKSNSALLDKTEKPMTEAEMQKYAYELGLDPKNVLTDDEHIVIQKRRKVRNLERRLDSQKERLNYSKVLPWLENDDEKINYLSIPSIEGRQAWVNKNKIWLRNKNVKDFENAVATQDIVLGMPADFVKKSWGEPDAIENSGNPIYKNERWKYLKQVSTPNGYHQEKRYVYLEGGRVVGWETE